MESKLLQDAPIRRKLTFLTMATVCFALCLSCTTLLINDLRNLQYSILNELETLALVIGNSSTAALDFDDAKAVKEHLEALQGVAHVQAAAIYTTDNKLFAYHIRQPGPSTLHFPDTPGAPGSRKEIDHLLVVRPIMLEGSFLGMVYLRSDLKILHTRILQYSVILLIVLSITLGLSFLVSRRLQRFISEPILNLAQTVSNISAKKDYSIRAKACGKDELGMLIGGFNHMLSQIQARDSALRLASEELEQRVTERTTELRSAKETAEAASQELSAGNQTLQDMVTQLQEAQDQLVQAEKMASLGELVAGIAHEINTPVGNGVTAASHLRDKVEAFHKNMETGSLKKSDLQRFLSTTDEASRMILSNLQRAAELVNSFKQVAVDQTSAQQRSFPVQAYIKEILLSLRPKLKKTAHQIHLECPEDLTIISYPGALSQIITNFIMNSLLHGYQAEVYGNLSITIRAKNNQLQLIYSDDGQGIPKERLSRIFDPFFTTRRGTGGTGLGLHVVFNLITQTLKGEIRCESTLNQGTQFYVEFPLQNQTKLAKDSLKSTLPSPILPTSREVLQ